MSGWMVASIAGGIFALVILALLVVVSRAVMRTARNATELMVALEEVQATTKALADLQSETGHTARVADRATAALEDQRVGDGSGTRRGNGRDVGN